MDNDYVKRRLDKVWHYVHGFRMDSVQGRNAWFILNELRKYMESQRHAFKRDTKALSDLLGNKEITREQYDKKMYELLLTWANIGEPS